MAEIELAKVETTETVPAAVPAIAPTQAAPRPEIDRIEEHACWPLLSQMTIVASAGIPLNGFKIGDLLRLAPGQIVESSWPHTEGVPLKAGRVQVGWSEFEVVDQHLVVRLTRLA